MKEPDLAHIDAQEFAGGIAGECARLFLTDGTDGLVVVAPSRMLGALREALSPNLRDAILAEITRTLTRPPVDQMSRFPVADW